MTEQFLQRWEKLLSLPYAGLVVFFEGSKAVVLADTQVQRQLIDCMKEVRVGFDELTVEQLRDKITEREEFETGQIVAVRVADQGEFLGLVDPIGYLNHVLPADMSILFFLQANENELGDGWRRDMFSFYEVG